MSQSISNGFRRFAAPSQEEAEEIETLIDVLQDDGQYLDYHSVKAGLAALGFTCSSEELAKVIEQCCPHGEQISRAEFSAVMMRFLATRTQEDCIKRDFELFDKDRKGYIDAADVQRVRSRAVKVNIDCDVGEMMDNFASDGRGRVLLADFARAVHPPIKGR